MPMKLYLPSLPVMKTPLLFELWASLVYGVRQRLGPRQLERARHRGNARPQLPGRAAASRCEPPGRRQLRSADLASLTTIARAVWRDRHPLVLSVRGRTVADVLSIGLSGGTRVSFTQRIPDAEQQLLDQRIRVFKPRDELDLGGIAPYEIGGYCFDQETAQVDMQGVERAVDADVEIDAAGAS